MNKLALMVGCGLLISGTALAQDAMQLSKPRALLLWDDHQLALAYARDPSHSELAQPSIDDRTNENQKPITAHQKDEDVKIDAVLPISAWQEFAPLQKGKSGKDFEKDYRRVTSARKTRMTFGSSANFSGTPPRRQYLLTGERINNLPRDGVFESDVPRALTLDIANGSGLCHKFILQRSNMCLRHKSGAFWIFVSE